MSENSVIKWFDLLMLEIDKNEKNIKVRENEIINIKSMISKMPKGNTVKTKILAKEHKIGAEKHISLCLENIKLTKLVLEEDIKTRVCLTRLAVIEKYILSRIWAYLLEYEYRTKSINDIRCNIVLTVKPQRGNLEHEFYISLAMPRDRVSISPKVEFFCFAELMIEQNKKYYGRRDFGLLPFVGENEDDDLQVFSINNLKELDNIFQKIDSWYGSGLD